MTAESDDTAVLVTRPEPGASETARRLAERGFTPIVAPLLAIARRTPSLPRTAQAILVTSANSLAPGLPTLPLLTVGDATAIRARALGHTDVTSAGRDATALAALAAQRLDPEAGPILLLSGAGQGLDLATALRAHGFRVLRRIAYAAHPATTLPPQAATMLATGRGHAMFFSPDTARAFTRLLVSPPATLSGIQAIAISEATAAALAPLPWARIRVASHPNQDAMFALLS